MTIPLTDSRHLAQAERAAGATSPEPPDGRQAREGDEEEREWREKVIQAWLGAFAQVGSVTTNARDARKNLERWQRFVSERDSARVESSLRLSLEVALAQGSLSMQPIAGPDTPHANLETRAFLVEQAREMLRNSLLLVLEADPRARTMPMDADR